MPNVKLCLISFAFHKLNYEILFDAGLLFILILMDMEINTPITKFTIPFLIIFAWRAIGPFNCLCLVREWTRLPSLAGTHHVKFAWYMRTILSPRVFILWAATDIPALVNLVGDSQTLQYQLLLLCTKFTQINISHGKEEYNSVEDI